MGQRIHHRSYNRIYILFSQFSINCSSTIMHAYVLSCLLVTNFMFLCKLGMSDRDNNSGHKQRKEFSHIEI